MVTHVYHVFFVFVLLFFFGGGGRITINFGPLDFVLRALRALRPVHRARFRSGSVKKVIFRKRTFFLKVFNFWELGHCFIVLSGNKNVHTVAWLLHFQCLAFLNCLIQNVFPVVLTPADL